MTKAIIGLPALVKQTKLTLRDKTKSPRYYNTFQQYEKNNSKTYSTIISLRQEYALPVFYKIIVEKNGQYIIANTLVEALLKLYRSQDAIYSCIKRYNEVMRSNTSVGSKSEATRRILESASHYPNTMVNREAEFEVIFDIHIYPVFFDNLYTVAKAADILSIPSNLVVQINKEFDKSDLVLIDQIVKAFFNYSPIETAKITAEAKFEELKKKTEPIKETAMSNNDVIYQKSQDKEEASVETKIKDIISDMIHEYLDESIDKLAQAIADEVNDCINEAVESRTSVYKKDIEAKIKNLFS